MTEFGIVAPQAYARISRFSSDGAALRYTVDIHADAAARSANKRGLDAEQYEFPLPVGKFEPLKDCYSDLKTRLKFVAGSDV